MEVYKPNRGGPGEGQKQSFGNMYALDCGLA